MKNCIFFIDNKTRILNGKLEVLSMKDTRFFKRECFLIDFKSFENLMQELKDDNTIKAITNPFLNLFFFAAFNAKIAKINLGASRPKTKIPPAFG